MMAQKRDNRRSAWRSGFTLVELMVVIGIIAVLAAIILPSSRIFAARRDRQSCMANLKAIGISLAVYREDYGGFPPDATEAFVGSTGQLESGLGLVSLYYLHAYAQQPPPWEGPGGQRLWDTAGYRGGDYLRNLKFFHCPNNPTQLDRTQLTNRSFWPYFVRYGNYDLFYRRDWTGFYGGDTPRTGFYPQLRTDTALAARWGQRTLLTAFPPSDTPVTWCIYHRNAPSVEINSENNRVTDNSTPEPDDRVIVLFADGSVVSKVSPNPSNYAEWLADLTQRAE